MGVVAALSVLGVWGHAPPGKLNHMRVLRSGCQKSPQPRIVYGNWSVTKAIHQLIVSRSPFPSESAFVFEALPQNCSLYLLGVADLSALCLQDIKQ